MEFISTLCKKQKDHLHSFYQSAHQSLFLGILLKIKKMTIINKDTCLGTDCNFNSDNISVEQFLEYASLDNQDSFCLSYLFTHRDFGNGVLGLSWIGSSGEWIIIVEYIYDEMM